MIALEATRGLRSAAVLGAFAVLLFLSSCSDDPMSPPIVTPPPPPSTGSPSVSWSFDAEAEGVAGAAASSTGALAVSGRSTYQLVSGAWVPVAPGNSASDISVSIDGELFALNGERIDHLVGDEWVKLLDVNGQGEFFAIQAQWAYNSDHVFVATTDDDEEWMFAFITLLEWNGTGWKGYELPYAAADIWGTSPTDVFVVGQHGMVVHFDGVKATAFANVTANNLLGVWGTSGSDVYAVGDQGKVAHYDGVSWTGLTRPTTLPLYVVRVIGGQLMVGGALGACFRYNAGAWEDLSIATANKITGLVDDGAGGIYATTTSGILHLENGKWRYAFGSSGVNMRGIWCDPDGGITVVGDIGVIEQRDAKGWHPAYAGASGDLWQAVSGTSESDIYAVGRDGKLAHYDGTAWSLHPSGTGTHLSAVWAAPGRTVIASKGSIREWSNDASVAMNGTIPSKDIVDMWGAGPDDIYAVGESGLLLHYDGSQWSKVEAAVSTWLTGVWGRSPNDVFVVGWSTPFDAPTRYYAATILHFDGNVWTRMPDEGVTAVDRVWGYDESNVIGVVSSEAALFDGHAWTHQNLAGAYQLDVYMTDICGSPGGDIFASSTSGDILRLRVTRGDGK